MPYQRPQHSQRGGQQESPVQELKNKISKYSDLKDMPAEELIKIAENLGNHLQNKNLKTTQIRRFLDGIRKIDMQIKKSKSFNKDLILLLRPKLAYSAGRNESVKPLMEVLDPAIIATKSPEGFKKLVALIESIFAYHKYYGGRD